MCPHHHNFRIISIDSIKAKKKIHRKWQTHPHTHRTFIRVCVCVAVFAPISLLQASHLCSELFVFSFLQFIWSFSVQLNFVFNFPSRWFWTNWDVLQDEKCSIKITIYNSNIVKERVQYAHLAQLSSQLSSLHFVQSLTCVEDELIIW